MKEKVLRLVQKFKKTFGGQTPTSVYNKIVEDSIIYGPTISKLLNYEDYMIFIFLVCSNENDLSKLYDTLKLKIFRVDILEVTDDDPESECDSCYGDGYVDCDYCDGNGKIDCDDCGGDGEDSDGDTCSNCDGEGDFECDYCDGSGREECYKCDGDGYIKHGDFFDVTDYTIISYDGELFNQLTYLPDYSILEDSVVHKIMDNDKCIISTSNDQRSDLTTENISTGDYVFDGITDLGQI